MILSGQALEGKVAIVTGGGRGLGRAIALALAEAGADVALAGRGSAAIETVADEVGALGRRAIAVPTDVTSESDCQALVERTVSELGHVDVMVANSGVLHPGDVLDTPTSDWHRVIDTNLNGTYNCARAVGPHLAAQRSGKVIVISSNWAYKGVGGFASYCASKAALLGLTRALAIEWARLNIQVNAIAPGYFETDINSDVREDDELTSRIVRQIPAKRMGRAEELGPLAVYLASSASDFVSGETIVVDGGQNAR